MSTAIKLTATERREKTKALALKGKTRTEIQKALNVSYQTVIADLKLLSIIPVSSYKTKENA